MKNNEIGGGFDTYGRRETCLCEIGGKPQGKKLPEDLGVEGRIITIINTS
jgi:hypothetical protein